MIGEKIRELRERNKLTQNDLARLLNITRSSVNAWESGLSVPSTQYVVELARIWKVSTDYLLGLNDTATISVTGLDTIEVGLLVETANKFRENREKEMSEVQSETRRVSNFKCLYISNKNIQNKPSRSVGILPWTGLVPFIGLFSSWIQTIVPPPTTRSPS